VPNPKAFDWFPDRLAASHGGIAARKPTRGVRPIIETCDGCERSQASTRIGAEKLSEAYHQRRHQ